MVPCLWSCPGRHGSRPGQQWDGACGPAQGGMEAGNGQLSFGEAGCFFSVIIIFKAVSESLLPIFQ